MNDANLTANQINDVVLVGGSTRIPAVKEILTDFFIDKNLDHKMNPDEAVAAGAAILAAQTGGNEEQKGGIEEIIMIDVTPITLGIEMA